MAWEVERMVVVEQKGQSEEFRDVLEEQEGVVVAVGGHKMMTTDGQSRSLVASQGGNPRLGSQRCPQR